MKAILLISHGSRSSKTKDELLETASLLKDVSNDAIVEIGFLELESPSIQEGIKNCIQKGANEIVVLLNFLNSGRHVDQDIPKIIEESRQDYPQVRIKVTKPLGQNKKIIELFKDLIDEA